LVFASWHLHFLEKIDKSYPKKVYLSNNYLDFPKTIFTAHSWPAEVEDELGREFRIARRWKSSIERQCEVKERLIYLIEQEKGGRGDHQNKMVKS
jgi:hypothetical protein